MGLERERGRMFLRIMNLAWNGISKDYVSRGGGIKPPQEVMRQNKRKVGEEKSKDLFLAPCLLFIVLGLYSLIFELLNLMVRVVPSEIPRHSERIHARDEKEIALCIKDLNAPSFYPSMISIWVTDSFERNDMERNLLTKLLINLAKSQDQIISNDQLIKGFESVLAVLEDAVSDAPRATEFLGHMFAKVILENVVSLSDIGQLIHEGGEEQGRLVEVGLAAKVLGSILEVIKEEKGESVLNEIRSSSNLRLEDFRPPGSNKSFSIDKFI